MDSSEPEAFHPGVWTPDRIRSADLKVVGFYPFPAPIK